MASYPLLDHLLRRSGFGASPSDLATFAPLAYVRAVDRLLLYQLIPDTVDSHIVVPRYPGVPLWLSWLSRIDPVTYGVDSLRQQVLSRSVPASLMASLALHPLATDVVVMAALAVAFIVPAVWQFGRQE